MTYEKTGSKKLSKQGADNAVKQQIMNQSTLKTVGILLYKHRVGLLALWAVTLTVLYIFPPLPDILTSIL